MSYRVIHVAQGSPEWMTARLGRLTASRAHDALARTQKGVWAKSRAQLRTQLALERITGVSAADPFLGNDMRRGTELEPQARRLYEATTGSLLMTTGFLQHETLMAGCSLDGHVGAIRGVVEFKCPRVAGHLENLRGATIDPEYRDQLLHQLWITGAEWGDLVSYCPQFPAPLQLAIRRVTADGVAKYERQARIFLGEVDLEEAAIRTMANPAAVLAQVVA